MKSFQTIAIAAWLGTLAAPAGADPLKGSEILQHLSGDWDYVSSRNFQPLPDFCKSHWNRMWMEGETYAFRSVVRGKPEDYYSATSGQLAVVDPDSVSFKMDLPSNEKPAVTRIWMRSEDFMVVQIRDAAPFYLKRCSTGERIS
jgi:hypothetical protein